jgi:transcriptional regulator with PAS, ATPase and Fis domain
MDSLEIARQLRDSGQYIDAKNALAAISPSRSNAEVMALRAEVCERLGDFTDAVRAVESVAKTRNATMSDRASCETTLGRIAMEHGEIARAIQHFQRSGELARQTHATREIFWANFHLLAVIAERSGPDAARPILAEMRRAASKHGDARTLAALHMWVGNLEARRALFRSSLHHISTGLQLLQTQPNLWMEALGYNVLLGIHLLRSEFREAKIAGERGLCLAEKSGVAAIRRSILGNLGILSSSVGELDAAVAYFSEAEKAFHSPGPYKNALLDAIARVHLAEGRLGDCEEVLEVIERAIQKPEDRPLTGNRQPVLLRGRLFAKSGLLKEAIAQCDLAVELACHTGDAVLGGAALLAKAEWLIETGDSTAAIDILSAVDILGQTPEFYSQSERIFACGLLAAGALSEARAHYQRARRICMALNSALEEHQLDASWKTANDRYNLSRAGDNATSAFQPAVIRNHAIHSLASMMIYPHRPEFVARELFELIRLADCANAISLVSRAPDGAETTLAEFVSETEEVSLGVRRFAVGFINGHSIEIVLKPKRDLESAATINAVSLLLSSIHDLERARVEREERATLWPVEEAPMDGLNAVISGHMREQIELARKIAPTDVGVLICGESGTGKEIIARAIHDYSLRAQKPFVAFNCAAIPRDLLESQLFGHRRGSFTGADRDQVGIIRTARDGTLFLDEIGELSQELQPKLLRFLESGEIAPIGEPAVTVNVRIVAATNNNLEEAVLAGRFREDLFYRLNVVRLSLRPLRERRDEIPGLVHYFAARSAEEFHKGHVSVPDETLERLTLYRWPGNVRQLQNEIRRMVALVEPGAALPPSAIAKEIRDALPPLRINGHEIAVSLKEHLLPTLARVEREMIKAALTEHHGRVDAVAKSLGISRKGLYLKRQRLGL